MRTTITLDEDVAAKLAAEQRRMRASFKDTINEVLRRGLAASSPRGRRRPFTVHARDLGALAPGLSLDNVAELLEHVEGPLHR